MTEEEALARIPFGPTEEQTIVGAAVWMRRMAAFQIWFGAWLAIMMVWAIGTLLTGSQLAGGIGFALGTATWALYLLWGGYILLLVAKHLDLVAKTDEADQVFLAVSFDNLKQYFMLEAGFGVLALLSSALLFIRAF